MPVGKNALKRVTNNGYSKVAVSAPDMEHSEVVKTEKATKKEESIKIEAKKNTTPKIKKPATPKPVTKKADEAKRPDGFARFELGSDLPVHLL